VCAVVERDGPIDAPLHDAAEPDDVSCDERDVGHEIELGSRFLLGAHGDDISNPASDEVEWTQGREDVLIRDQGLHGAPPSRFISRGQHRR